MSCISGMPTIIPNVIRSRRIWMNSFTTTAQNRAGLKTWFLTDQAPPPPQP
ncbi:MAG: hypothetical protein M5U12_05880 [Verrucomicrobia bacterium]|nr:hypothetical protein [Verrucomicrobiota bacterium]